MEIKKWNLSVIIMIVENIILDVINTCKQSNTFEIKLILVHISVETVFHSTTAQVFTTVAAERMGEGGGEGG